MNWKLIFSCSLFGLLMAIATISWIPEKFEFPFWLVIFIINAYIIAKNADGKYFLTGFMVSLVNCIYIVAFHVIFYKTFIVNHPMMVDMSNKWPLHNHGRIQMLLTGPVFGIGFGLIQGLFAWIASMIFKKKTA